MCVADDLPDSTVSHPFLQLFTTRSELVRARVFVYMCVCVCVSVCLCVCVCALLREFSILLCCSLFHEMHLFSCSIQLKPAKKGRRGRMQKRGERKRSRIQR